MESVKTISNKVKRMQSIPTPVSKDTGYDVNPISFVPLQCTGTASAKITITQGLCGMDGMFGEVPINKKEEAMYDKTREATLHLERRLNNVYYTIHRALEREFGLEDDVYPKTPQEIVDRIKSGQYVLPPQEDFYNAFESIRWRDPAKKEDYDGFKAASAKVDKAKNAVNDLIQVMSPEVALKALQEFEATPTTAYH